MTKPPAHTIRLRKHRREPLDPRWSIECSCGHTEPPTDLDSAKQQRAQHEARVTGRGDDTGTGVGL